MPRCQLTAFRLSNCSARAAGVEALAGVQTANRSREPSEKLLTGVFNTSASSAEARWRARIMSAAAGRTTAEVTRCQCWLPGEEVRGKRRGKALITSGFRLNFVVVSTFTHRVVFSNRPSPYLPPFRSHPACTGNAGSTSTGASRPHYRPCDALRARLEAVYRSPGTLILS